MALYEATFVETEAYAVVSFRYIIVCTTSGPLRGILPEGLKKYQ